MFQVLILILYFFISGPTRSKLPGLGTVAFRKQYYLDTVNPFEFKKSGVVFLACDWHAMVNLVVLRFHVLLLD